MFTSTELIDALRRRMRRSLRPQPSPGTFPPGWAAWFASMRERVGQVTGATAAAIVAILVAREPALPPRAIQTLNQWQSFTTLWRQQWHPAGEDDRRVRVFAAVFTVVVHLFFAIFLVYLAYVRFMAISSAPARVGDEVVVQVEFIGDGTPEDQGGGPQQDETDVVQPSDQAPAQPPAQTTQVAPIADVQPPAPTEPSPPPPLDQPLQVTQTPVPDQLFTLPPPRIVELPQPEVEVPELDAPTPELRIVDVPMPVQPVIQPELPDTLPPREIRVPQLEQPPAEIVVREIPAPPAPVRLPDAPRIDITAPPLETPELDADAPEIVTRSIPAPRVLPETSPAAPRDADSSGSAAPEAQAATGSGIESAPPGALPSPTRGDDWDLAGSDTPGGQAGQPDGLFGADGRPNLAPGDDKVGGGLPPGTITEDFAKIDRHGTWLKRPPTDYEPSSFDRFWLPNETLLEEWVRRSITEVLIPIPGTSKTITCSVVLLALGGACGITDPNMQDVEATAREPPDVPFKPELQENQDSLADPPQP